MAPSKKIKANTGLTVVRHGEQLSVTITRQKSEYAIQEGAPLLGEPEAPASLVETTGKLLYADSTPGTKDIIRVVADDGSDTEYVVPSGMMSDIVKPLWGEDVRVSGIRDGKTNLLQQVDALETLD